MKAILICLLLFVTSCGDVIINKHSIMSCNFKKPDIEHLNFSGVLKEGNHKGWLYDSPSRRVIVTCSHTGPAYGRPVVLIDKNGNSITRQIIKVYKIEVSMERDKPLTAPIPQNLLNSDTSVCVLDKPVPPEYKAYSLAHKIQDGDWVIAYHQDNTASIAYVATNENTAIVSRSSADRPMLQGDSGLPWFSEHGNVMSHTTLTEKGHGPLYTHPLVRGQLYKYLDEAEEFAINN